MDTQFSIKQTTMCCRQWNNSKWSSSKKWRTPRVSVNLLFLIHISDINYEIADSTVSGFADDTRILIGIKDEEDTQMRQNDFDKLYKLADTKFNNMKFNAYKFELLRYGKREWNIMSNNLQIIWSFKYWQQRTSQRSRHNDE